MRRIRAIQMLPSIPLLTIVLLPSCGDDPSPPSGSEGQGPFGGTLPTAEEFAASPKALPPEVRARPSNGAPAADVGGASRPAPDAITERSAGAASTSPGPRLR